MKHRTIVLASEKVIAQNEFGNRLSQLNANYHINSVSNPNITLEYMKTIAIAQRFGLKAGHASSMYQPTKIN